MLPVVRSVCGASPFRPNPPPARGRYVILSYRPRAAQGERCRRGAGRGRPPLCAGVNGAAARACLCAPACADMAAPPRPARACRRGPCVCPLQTLDLPGFSAVQAPPAGLTSGARWATMIDGSACPAPPAAEIPAKKGFLCLRSNASRRAGGMPRNLHPHPSLAVSHPAVLPHRAKRLRLTAWRFPQGAGISAGACSRCRKAGVCAGRALLPGRKELFPVLPPSAVCRLIQRSRRRNGGSHHETGSFVG